MKRLFILCLFLLLTLTTVVYAQSGQTTVINGVTLLTDSARRYEKIELVADITSAPDITNPYDPDQIRVDGEFRAPSGVTVTVPGFYYRDYQYDADSGTLAPTDNWSWRVRYTPTETGDYHYQVMVTTADGTLQSETGKFSVADSDNPGFIRVDSRNPRYFAFDNGTPYFPIGENMGWSNSPDPLADFDHWLGKLSDAGGNFVRVWMPPWGFDIEWLDTGLGNYDKRQGQAYQLDRVMDMLDEHHVYMMLSLLNHGQFSTTTNPEWHQNPFNEVNGGPCADPQCFATDPAAIKYWQQRLRYIAARWGYSTQIMAFEWWNEINWTPLQTSSILAPWLKQSGDLLRSLDPNQHLITHEGNAVNDTAVWNTPTLDFTQDHRYNMQNILFSFKQVAAQWLTAYPDKPFLFGEFGDPLAIDNLGLFLHLGLWSGAMNGTAGSGMTWYWDDFVDRLNLYDQFAAISAFFRDEDMGAYDWQPTSAKFTTRGGAAVYGLQADDEALLWVVSSSYSNQTLTSQYNDAIRQAIRIRQQNGAAYSFEDSAQGWALDASGVAGINAAVSGDQATDGKGSLAVNTHFTGSTYQEAIVGVQPQGKPTAGIDWSAHTGIGLDIYAPAGASDFGAQIFIKTGGAETETGSEHVNLQPGQWNHITVQFSSLADLHDVRALGIKIGTNFTVFDGTFLIDNIIFSNAPDVNFQFKDVANMTVALSDLKPASYAVELWDTQKGIIINTMQIATSDGTINIPLPTFNTDLAIKVKAT